MAGLRTSENFFSSYINVLFKKFISNKLYFKKKQSFILVRGRCNFPYILLNEIQTKLSQLATLSVDLCTDHAHYAKNQRSTVLGRNKNMAVEDGTAIIHENLVSGSQTSSTHPSICIKKCVVSKIAEFALM